MYTNCPKCNNTLTNVNDIIKELYVLTDNVKQICNKCLIGFDYSEKHLINNPNKPYSPTQFNESLAQKFFGSGYGYDNTHKLSKIINDDAD